MTMRCSCYGMWVAFALSVVVTSGCGQDPFAPPSRPRSIPSTDESKKATAIYFVVPGVPVGELEMWAIEAQREANDHQAIYRIMGPGPADLTVTLPEIVKKAVADGASGLIVVPNDSKDLPQALADAEAHDVPVVLLGKSIPAPPGSKPFTYVDHAPIETFAKRIVSATVDDLKKIGRPLGGTALVLADQKTDETSGRRVEALRAAATAAGFKKVVTVPVDSTEIEKAKRTFSEAVKANPDVSVALADDTETMFVASQVRVDLKGTPHFFVGGFGGYRMGVVQASFLRESSFFDARYEELARLAVVTLLKKLKGESVGVLVEQGPRFTRGIGSVSSELEANGSMPATQKSSNQKDLLKDIAPPLDKLKPQ